jgi:polyferredoxin
MIQRGTIGWLKHDITHRGYTAWILCVALILFYLLLYFPDKLAEFGHTFKLDKATIKSLASWGNTLNFFEHSMKWLGKELGVSKWALQNIFHKWTLYGTLYTLAITAGGIGMIRRYGHNRYQVIRTVVVMITQATLAYSIPMLMSAKGYYSYYFSYMWPLKIDYLYPESLKSMPLPLVLYSILSAFLLVPILAALFGKRWYCSWICGCGGLANTFGEPWRHLSSKSQRAWDFEKFSIHITLVISILTTSFVVISAFLGAKYPGFERASIILKFLYGTIVVAFLSGAIGTALYPIGGTRIWCRYFCPMAALLGVTQKFGRYRITVKEDMCISCGMCSKYCEMGIDVRAYAQNNQSFTRASCVGCGLCAEVCPRGVLRLENRTDRDPQELTMHALLSESYKQLPPRSV